MQLPSRNRVAWAIAAAPVLLIIYFAVRTFFLVGTVHRLQGQVATQNVEAAALRESLGRARTVADSTSKLLSEIAGRADSVIRPLRGRVIVRPRAVADGVSTIDTLTPALPPADTGALTMEEAARALPLVVAKVDSLISAGQVREIAFDHERTASLLVEQTLRAQAAEWQRLYEHERNPLVRAGRAGKWILVGAAAGAGAVLLIF